ncbi:MAG: DMT family transporter [Bdellovibrionales bacterium]|nr:DMT family transporter [Bdellovibrionales bacterium]
MSNKQPKIYQSAQAFSELFLAAVIWGFGFTATVWALKSIDPISLTVVRFSAAFIIGIILYKVYQILTPHAPAVSHRTHFIYSMLPGFFLSMTLAFQTWGLELTTATNSGFITTLYVVLVPLFQKIFFKRKIPMIHGLWVVLALVGTALMIQFEMGDFNIGDILTFVCAIFAALQIIWIGRIQNKIQSAFLFNAYQSLWSALSALLLVPFYGALYIRAFDNLAIFGMLSVTLGSTLLAFALQVRAQKILTPSVASMIYLMESPFAAIFAVLLLKEVISPLQLGGGILIFVSAIGATINERARASSQKADPLA